MTYVEKMVDKIVPDEVAWTSEEAIDKYYEAAGKHVNQIITDTKAACFEAVREAYHRFKSPILYDYETAIIQAEVKE